MTHRHSTARLSRRCDTGEPPNGPAHAKRPRRVMRRIAIVPALFVLLRLAACASPSPKPVELLPERARITRISEQPGSVRLDGLSPLVGFAHGKDCTFIHCLEVVTEGLGRPFGYDELMGVSGMAFRLQFRVDRWDVGNSDPLVGESNLDLLFEAVGWEYEVRIVRRDQMSEAAALRGQIAQSLDRSVPVLAANIIRPEDWGIVVGYRADQQWLCRSYNNGALSTDAVANGWPTAVVLLNRRTAPAARQNVLRASIRQAVDLFQRRQSGRYALGSQAFDAWSRGLRSASDRSYLHPNAWTYVCLMDARAAAARYLRSIAREFGAQGKHLEAAAIIYEEELRILREGYRYVPSESSFPDSMPPQEMRDRQIDTLQRAKSHEEQAIAELERAM
ncbi:MAG: hypothetical protein KF841_10080 [Phycisphaerae bacterium]|nr:hypothetical protein [Phycisphaerae bacterium]